MTKKALIAMSGGVDSSVAALLVQKAGYECAGGMMRLFDDGKTDEEATASARQVCRRLGIPFHALHMEEEFHSCVIGPFVDSYSRGVTPNPCVECNRYLKFGELLQKGFALGCSHIATGHYARVEQDPETGRYILRKAVNLDKDQSYVLYSLTQDQLKHVLFPLGGLSKPEVRAIADREGFVSAHQAESQDICFVPNGKYAEVVEQLAGKTFPSGDFVDLSGNVIGTHRGIIHYTIGQHKHLGQSFGKPMYVCRIDGERNQVALGSNEDVFSASATAGDFNWISGEVPAAPVRAKVRLRYKQQEQWAEITPVTIDGKPGAEIRFDEPQRAVTPGQAAVVYDGDRVLGGGTIL